MSWVQRPPMGDPGLFSVLGKVVGGIANVATGGLARTAYDAAKGILASGKRTGAAGTGMQLSTFRPQITPVRTQPLMPQAVAMPGGAVIRADSVKVTGTSIGFGAYQRGEATIYGPAVGQPGKPTGTCLLPGKNGGPPRLRATHANKSSYFLKDGTRVEAGTRCVANRRRNPLNPRALSRAMSRVQGAQKAIKSLVRFESVSRGGKVIVKRPAKRCR